VLQRLLLAETGSSDRPPQRGECSRRAALRGLVATALTGAIGALSACTNPLPARLGGPKVATASLTLVVGDAYTRIVGPLQDWASSASAVDTTIRKWATKAEELLDRRVALAVRVVDLAHGSLRLDATQMNAAAERPLYLASHPMLWRLRADGILADVRAQASRDKPLQRRLRPDALACLQWRGQQAGLPVALWPLLSATDARLPAPPANWDWQAVGRIPAGSGWPAQLLPGVPPLEAWLWPQGADVASPDMATSLLAQPSAVAALTAYAGSFGAAGALSPLLGAGVALAPLPRYARRYGGFIPGADETLQSETARMTAWSTHTLDLAAQQVRQRQVQVWFPLDEWPPTRAQPHAWQDTAGPLRRLAPPGSTRAGLPLVAYGLGTRQDAPQPDLMYRTMRALQDAAPTFLPYSPMTDEQTAGALQKQWTSLDAGQAAALADVLALRLRPVWGFPGPRQPPSRFLAFLPEAIAPAWWDNLGESDHVDLPAELGDTLQALCIVLALRLRTPQVAATDANHAVQRMLDLWATPG